MKYFFLTVALAAITLFVSLNGCDLLPGDLNGVVDQNQLPVVEFANIPAPGDTFSYAPVVYWKGRDPDGFVEFYSYADIIDATALTDPRYYVDFIPKEAWVTTEATSDTVYLLTEKGKVTEHVFYLKGTDDRGSESEVIYRRFSRSNHAPSVPMIKWISEPDYTYGYVNPDPNRNPDSTSQILKDTLYCLDQITNTWRGLGFNWKSSDLDDSELYKIPLEYRYYLERVPHDTVWEWTSTTWTEWQDLRFGGLETGHYTFTVWARDDGYETSVSPAAATFDVYKPTFEQSILLLNTTEMNAPPPYRGRWNLIPGTPIADLYKNLVSRYPDVEYREYTGGPLYKSYVGRFRLVINFSENQASTTDQATTATDTLEQNLIDYVNIGGRLWVNALMMRAKVITNNTLSLANSTFAGPPAGQQIPQGGAEFTSAISGVTDLPDLEIDTAKTAAMYRAHFVDTRSKTGWAMNVFPLLPGVDIMTAGLGVETAYYFNSYTDTASGDMINDTVDVRAYVDTINYPPTSVDCIIALSKDRVKDISRIENITRGTFGYPVTKTNHVRVGTVRTCVVKVSYDYGEPWSVTDTVLADYTYLPFSEFHMKPCAIRYERLAATSGEGYEVLYRVAVFNFPLYYMNDQSGKVTRMFNSMLDWFFLPYAH